jgi:hypothetical protein
VATQRDERGALGGAAAVGAVPAAAAVAASLSRSRALAVDDALPLLRAGSGGDIPHVSVPVF